MLVFSHRFPVRFAALVALMLWASCVASVLAQPTPTPKSSGDDLIIKKSDQSRSGASQELPPVERPIDPALYYLGPNDQLMLSVPLIEGGEFPIVVAMDNTIMLPRGFPLVDTRNMTLARLRHTVDSMFRARSSSYRNVVLSLVKPRSIYVSVSGDVLFPDRYVVTAADRATTVIDLANRISNESLTKDREEEIAEMRRRMRDDRMSSRDLGARQVRGRWVTLRHNDGSIVRLDLLRYRALGAERDNPTLREGDEVVVHPADQSMPTVAVVGAVNTPMVIPHAEGDNALLLFRLAGGMRADADQTSMVITRRSGNGLTRITLEADSAVLAGTPVLPGDQLMVAAGQPAVAGGNRAGAVSVIGEVQRPATYPIIPGVTKLSEVLQLAGGVTPDAALNGAFISRSVDLRYQKQAVDLAREPGAAMATSGLALDDTTRLKFDLENQQNRVSVDFVEVVARGNASRDVALESGDEIVIPPSPKSVFIRGRVRNPGWLAYQSGADLQRYVDLAGGYTDAAEPDRLQVLKYGTGIWMAADEAQIMPGDEIYVPGERDLPGRTSLEIASSIIGITGGIASLAFTVFTFVRELTKNP